MIHHDCYWLELDIVDKRILCIKNFEHITSCEGCTKYKPKEAE